MATVSASGVRPERTLATESGLGRYELLGGHSMIDRLAVTPAPTFGNCATNLAEPRRQPLKRDVLRDLIMRNQHIAPRLAAITRRMV